MKKRSANNEPSPFPYKVIKKEFVKPSTEEKIRILNEKMDMVLRNQRKMLGVLRQMITQPSDSFGPKIISINSIRQMMSPESEDWFPQSFPLVELQQIETIEEEMNDPIKSSLYIQTMKDILKPDGTFRPGGLKKHFHLIFAIEFLVEFNFDGIHNKIPLKKFDNFNNALYESLKRDGYFRDDYIAEIRVAFRTYKNRRNKNVSDARRKIKEAMANIEPEVKFEEIMCPQSN